MEYLVELYDDNGKCVYKYRQSDALKALQSLVELMEKPDLYPFRTATCYQRQKILWELSFK